MGLDDSREVHLPQLDWRDRTKVGVAFEVSQQIFEERVVVADGLISIFSEEGQEPLEDSFLRALRKQATVENNTSAIESVIGSS